MSGVLVLPHGAPEDVWLARRREGIGASEIAAIMGISPWESRFSTWWRKREGWDSPANDEMSVGKFLEPTIAAWFEEFGDPNENLTFTPAGLYRHPEREWQLATPDRLLWVHDMDDCGCDLPDPWSHEDDCSYLERRLVGLLECKWVAHSWDGWGEENTDQVPVYYRAQALWQLDVMGVDEVLVCALGPGGFRVYRVHRDERDLLLMREEGRRFMESLAAGEPPDVDDHSATLRTLKALHPTVDDIDIEVPVDFAEGYRRARALASRTAALVDRFDARARLLLGNGRRLMVGKKLVVSRSVYDQSGDSAELTAIDGEWPTTDRLNPGRAKTYV